MFPVCCSSFVCFSKWGLHVLLSRSSFSWFTLPLNSLSEVTVAPQLPNPIAASPVFLFSADLLQHLMVLILQPSGNHLPHGLQVSVSLEHTLTLVIPHASSPAPLPTSNMDIHVLSSVLPQRFLLCCLLLKTLELPFVGSIHPDCVRYLKFNNCENNSIFPMSFCVSSLNLLNLLTVTKDWTWRPPHSQAVVC